MGFLSPEAVADPPVFARARAVAHFEDGPVRQLVSVEIQRQNGTGQTARGLDGAGRQRNFGRGRSSRAGAPAPPPPCRAPIQSGARSGAIHLNPMRRPCRSFRPRAGQADALSSWALAFAAGTQFTGRVSRNGRNGTANRRPRRGADRRCHDLGGDRQRRFARAAARRRQTRRCLGFRASCMTFGSSSLGLEIRRHLKIGLGVRFDFFEADAIGKFDQRHAVFAMLVDRKNREVSDHEVDDRRAGQR
jgi:hypothetical protein